MESLGESAAAVAAVRAPDAFVTVIVPCRNEERFIQACLDSIVATKYPQDRLEVLVVDGMSDDRTRAIIDEYAARRPFIRRIDNVKRVPSAAVNIGIRAARGDILVRLDAHSVYPDNYIPRLVDALRETGASNVGGVLTTVPSEPTPIARAIATAMSHPFGVGNALFRIGASEPRSVETVAFFCCRRETFETVGLLDEESADEDSDFNTRLIDAGGKVVLLPDVGCRYYARSTIRDLASLFYRYGSSKPGLAWKHRRVQTWRQLVPPSFVLASVGMAALSPFLALAAIMFEATVLCYLLAVIGCSLHAGRPERTGGAALALVFPVVHVCYGIGVIIGACRIAYLRGTRRTVKPAALRI